MTAGYGATKPPEEGTEREGGGDGGWGERERERERERHEAARGGHGINQAPAERERGRGRGRGRERHTQREKGTVSIKHLLFAEDVGSGWYYGSDAVRSPLHYMRNPGEPAYDGSPAFPN
jgi:hypothetical protein